MGRGAHPNYNPIERITPYYFMLTGWGDGVGLQFADALHGNHGNHGKAWTSYKTDAWGANELDPVAGQKHVNGLFGGEEVGATIVDSLDTLKLMGLEDELASDRAKHDPSNHSVVPIP